MKKSTIFKELKHRIIFFDYKPKELLNVKELAKEFGVSAIPIREALIRLEEQKLISIIPNNGVHVSDLSFQELKDVFEVRLFLLGMTGKLAAKRATSQEIKELKILAEKMKQEKSQKKIVELDAQFHNLLNKATKNEVLVDSLEKLRNRLGRLWYLAEKGESYSLQIPAEINSLIQALEERDGEKCKQILEEHASHFIEKIKINLYNGYPV